MTADVYTPEHSDEQAVIRAMTDRWRLARLHDRGLVKRMDGEYERAHPEETRQFVWSVGQRRQQRGVNLALRPKRKKRHR